ncbi:gliding motility-associated C-terminal domain-containing protein [Hymenobacter edaphi]|uniref:Gliding motility-associated C-terminal domain-containing protein n=1 Tax=Hymenobacter edaphi TaxID=2211146 RepID=A0A328BFD1_9BACT|nr:gliding motility-associated C-terminal domain-containing protein [Hymenobacter edaphi]RAK66112.1 gliding motility-associated C-terminal domain-containing protein [Hymenobacter edaphi]
MILPLLRGRLRAWAGSAFLVVLSVLTALPARATHIRAGDIQAQTDTTAARNPLRIFFKMVTYTDATQGADADNTETIFFGDGTSSGKDAITRVSRVNIGNNVNRNVYYFEHLYNAAGRYTVSFIGENRNGGIRNVPQSSSRNFYIHTQITIDPVLVVNHSPVLNAPAVDRAAAAQVYLHNPAASDEDGDSLAYKLRICQWEPRGVDGVINSGGNVPNPVNLPGYVYPQDQMVSPNGVQVAYSGTPAGVPGTAAILVMDERTGQMVWNAPSPLGLGEFNVAFVVEEWRRDAFGGRRKIGEVVRDMQITVFASSNQRPIITVPRDTCVVAGTTITRTVTATDPDNNPLRLSAYGGMLPTPASFVTTLSQPGRAVGRFSWATSCSDVASDAKIVLFKVEDVPASGQTLIDERPWRITVVGPPPTGLRAVAAGTAATLTWDRYVCQNATRILIYRKENQSGWSPGSCETGIPASAGYTLVGEVAANAQTYTDTNGGRGLERGKTYCYRIYAEFPRPAGGASIASQEVCLAMQGRATLLTNVTVERTDAATGQIGVRWTAPAPAAGFPAPLGYRLYRAEGQSPAANAYTLVRTATSLTDTTHTDTNLNTRDRAYTYRLEFFRATPEVVEPAGPASSVRLVAAANPVGTTVKLTWTYNVPWDNSVLRTRIYRRDADPAAPFVLVGDTVGARTGGTFTDRSSTLRKDQTYCYRVETVGTYGAPNQPSNLLNLSQVQCVTLAAVPCPPVLTLLPVNCDSIAAVAQQAPNRGRTLLYTNRLTWTLGSTPADCSRNISFYRVLYSPTPDGPLLEIGRTPVPSFVHSNLASAAGCYAVVAVDSLGNSSAQSNVACQDNCQFFLLPNIFTPDNDGRNDVFRPISASPIVRAKVQIFNRWGVKVYEGNASSDLTLWDGGGAAGGEVGGRDTGAKAVAGTYYYLIEVQFADLSRTTKTYKGWVEVMR